MNILIFPGSDTFSKSVCCDLEEAERYKQRLENERSGLKDGCQTKVSKTVENVKKEFSKAISNVIRQFAGEKRERERERGERGRKRERDGRTSRPQLSRSGWA